MSDEKEPEPKGKIASALHESTKLGRFFAEITPDQFLRVIALVMAAIMGFLFYYVIHEFQNQIAYQSRANESEAERSRQHCDQREDEARRMMQQREEGMRKWQAEEREKDRQFQTGESEKNRTVLAEQIRAIHANTSKLDQVLSAIKKKETGGD
jgi:uncharacterized protein HemX